MVWPLWEIVWWFLTKLNVLLTYNPAIMLFLIYSKELETCVYTQTCTWIFIIGVPWLRWQRIHLQCGRPGFYPRVGKMPWRKAWQTTPVLFPEETPWTEEPDGLQSMGSQRVGHDWVTKHTQPSRVSKANPFTKLQRPPVKGSGVLGTRPEIWPLVKHVFREPSPHCPYSCLPLFPLNGIGW